MQDDSSGATGGRVSDTGSNAPPFLTVTELAQRLKATVESQFDFVRIRAEISRPTRAASGHLYFTLKDERNTLDGVCWKTVAGSLAVQPEEGLEVVVTGKLTIYGGRSKYQIVVQTMEMAGEGAMLKQLEERRRRLAAEGLFDAERKQPIPRMPAVIGVVTSPTGAVIRDILHRLTDRFGVRVLLWGTLVQGPDAAGQVARAIRGFDSMPPNGDLPRPDLVIVARGGGSLEDLWAFNEEEVVRAAADCRIPLISAIGHETDTTLIDFAADQRAPTPTAAAEMAVPVRADLLSRIAEIEARVRSGIAQRLDRATQALRAAERGLLNPAEMVERRAQAVDLAVAGLERGLQQRLSAAALRLTDLGARLRPPERRFGEVGAELGNLGARLDHAMGLQLDRQGAALDQAARLLEANSFQRVLERGFALVTTGDGTPVKRAAEAPAGAAVQVRFADGDRTARLDPETGSAADPPRPARTRKPASKPASDNQDSLF
ncbi:MAG: exodeoxyribonuclease VII large subunit [Pseudomonadota bacterium]|nr:exodeoxyribonuclease VII large subunit [Pseudomonadota bacterium]